MFGRKHCYRLYTEHLNEAVRWVCAVQKVIDSKAPVQTPTQLLMRDVEVSPWHQAARAHSCKQHWDECLGTHVPQGGGGGQCQALSQVTPRQLLPLLCPSRSTETAPRFWSRSIAATPSCATPVAPSTLPCCPSPMAAWTKVVRGMWGAQSWVLQSGLVGVMAGLDTVQGRWSLGWGLAGPGCEDSAQLVAGGPGEDHGALNPHPIPQPLAPAVTPRCATRL